MRLEGFNLNPRFSKIEKPSPIVRTCMVKSSFLNIPRRTSSRHASFIPSGPSGQGHGVRGRKSPLCDDVIIKSHLPQSGHHLSLDEHSVHCSTRTQIFNELFSVFASPIGFACRGNCGTHLFYLCNRIILMRA